jgi:hypothetical protein
MLASVCLGGVLLVVAAGGAAPALSVHGDSDCPTAEEVSVALLGLVVSPNPSGAQDVVALSAKNIASATRRRLSRCGRDRERDGYFRTDCGTLCRPPAPCFRPC